MKKRILALVLVLCMALTLVACGPKTDNNDNQNNDNSNNDAKVIKIGVFEPLTGDSGAGGKKEYLGMQYANSLNPTVELNGETYTIELVPSDNNSDSSKAVSAASNLVNANVAMVLGSYGSSVSMAASETFNDAGLAAVGVTCTNPGVTAGNDHYFRICFLDPFQGTVLANYAADLGATKAYCLGELGNEYDQGLIAYFTQAFEAAGGTVVADSFPKDNSDFTTYINKAKSEGAEVFFCPVSIAYATQIISQAATLDVSFPFLGSDTLDDNMVLEAAKGTNIQLYVTTFYAEGGNPDFDAGIKEYLNSNSEAMTNNGGNDTISAVTVMGYDAYNLALEALKAAGSGDPAAVKAALPSVTHTGVSGAIAFDEIGDAKRDTAFIKTANTTDGVWEFVKEQAAA